MIFVALALLIALLELIGSSILRVFWDAAWGSDSGVRWYVRVGRVGCGVVVKMSLHERGAGRHQCSSARRMACVGLRIPRAKEKLPAARMNFQV
ncbi:hypothetical protein HMPREF9278_0866 [Mobiluncus mulieris FB024-16]|nr:hypothetical protein HMPREF9278_0866 [Mobiluncus mulieris FB024-16]